MFSTVVGDEYLAVFSTVGDILGTVGEVQYSGRYLEYHGVFSTVGIS